MKPSNYKGKVAIIAPANSMESLNKKYIDIGVDRLLNLGLEPIFGKSVLKNLNGIAGAAKDRVEDIHAAFLDPDVIIIMAVYGGYNSNDLLELLDYDLISKNKKIFIGYSDVTALLNAIYTKTTLITAHGPGFASFCNPKVMDETVENFIKFINCSQSYVLSSPQYATYDKWYLHDKGSTIKSNLDPNWYSLYPGVASGTLIGGNIDTFLSLAGTPYFPSVRDSILLLESVADDDPNKFKRGLMQLRHMGVFSKIKGLILGQYPLNNKLADKKVLHAVLQECIFGYDFPILANVSCSHTDPLYALPIGGVVEINCWTNNIKVLR